jgi:hypothetical protein
MRDLSPAQRRDVGFGGECATPVRADERRGSIFRTVDGSNCNHSIDVSTLAGRSAAYSLLRTRGLIRVALAVPTNADYKVVRLNNPYGCNEEDVISMYRRPLPSTNLRFLSAVMFDERESSPTTGTTKILHSNYPISLLDDLAHQSMDALQATLKEMEPGQRPRSKSRSWISRCRFSPPKPSDEASGIWTRRVREVARNRSPFSRFSSA